MKSQTIKVNSEEIHYPVIIMTKDNAVDIVKNSNDLRRCTWLGYRHNKYNDAKIFDIKGNEFKILSAKNPRWLYKYWGWKILTLPPIMVEVDLDIITKGQVPFVKVKNLFKKLINNHELLDSIIGGDEISEEMLEANDFDELIAIFHKYDLA